MLIMVAVLLGAAGWLAAACLARHIGALTHFLEVLHEQRAAPGSDAWRALSARWRHIAALYGVLTVLAPMLMLIARVVGWS